ncbi:hypothetical protein [Anaerotignum sp.]
MKKDEKLIFHNTQLLLEHYRDVVWSLEVSVFQANTNFQSEFGSTIEEFLELSYEAGLDLPSSDVAARIRSINKSRNMLRIIDSAVALLREKYRNGEECYWVLYYTYLSPQEIGGVDEIVERISNMFQDFSRSTYYRRKNESIKRMGDLLWGFTTNTCDPALELLYTDKILDDGDGEK